MNSYYFGMKSIVSEKGQVTIPKALRNKLGLRAGTVLEFQAMEGKLIGVKTEAADPLRKWLGKGRMPYGLGVDAYLERVRG
jgi:antitoxin PrlF